MASGEYAQGSKGRRELPKLQRTSQSTDVRRSCARANSWRVRVVATPKKTEIEVRGDAGAAAGDPGVASQAEVGARSRLACVKKRRSVQ
jgi:hypothetical protein